MIIQDKLLFLNAFSSVEDPRVNRTKDHELIEILAITICGVICGADNWVAIEQWGKAKLDWLKTFLFLKNGIPCHDTFGRVFMNLEPEQLQLAFINWVQTLAQVTEGQIIALDGKTLRKSFDTATNKAAIHMVSAWASANNLVLGQLATDEKSNEITAIPKLLELLVIKGCVITIDAMGCQKKIAEIIVKKEADYILHVKKNQPTLMNQIEGFFDEYLDNRCKVDKAKHDFFEEKNESHGRIETRKVLTVPVEDSLVEVDAWKGLKSLVRVERIRELSNKIECNISYYISTIYYTNARRIGEGIRNHWGIENKVHWILDVAFDEDQCRVRKGYAAQNLAVIRHIALNLLKHEYTARVGIKNKRLRAGWDNDYLLKVLTVGS